MAGVDLTDGELKELYQWVDTIPLSKCKKNINRDFSDAGTIEYSDNACI